MTDRTSRRTPQARRDRLRRTLAAIEDGLRDTLNDPEAAARQSWRARIGIVDERPDVERGV